MPLIEVVIELRWQITQNELTGIQYLYGDLYNELKDKFPHRGITPSIDNDA